MLSVLALCCALILPPTVTVGGDSVVVTVSVADNASQPVSVDSVGFYIEITGAGSSGIRVASTAHVAGVTTHRFAYPLTLWAPNQTLSGIVGSRLGHVEGAVVAWSNWVYTTAPTWSFTRTVPAPNVPAAGTITASPAALN